MIRRAFEAGFSLSNGHDPRLTRGLILSLFEGVLAAIPYLLAYAALHLAFSSNISSALLWAISIGLFACVVLRIVSARTAMPLVFSGAYALMAQARLRVADHLRKVPMGWFARQRDGDLAARLTSDLEVVEHVWSHFLGMFTASLASSSFLVLFLFWLDWRLTLIMLAGLPLALMALTRTHHLATQAGTRLARTNASVQSALLEYVRGIGVIRHFGRFNQAFSNLERTMDEHHTAMLAIELKPTPWLVAYGFLLEAGYISLILGGAWLASTGTLTLEILAAFLVMALPVYRQLFDIGLSTVLLRFAHRALLRVESILAEPALAEPDLPCPPKQHDIAFENVSFSYDGTAVLDDVSCRISANALTAVIGASGSGKSTLLHLIARLWDVDNGTIRIGGVDVRNIGSGMLHQHVAMVFQDVVLFSGTVFDNLCIGCPGATHEKVVAATRRAQAHDFIMRLPEGYNTVLDEGGTSLSGGERQRISIARALLKDAPVLLLDEVTASIDPSAEAEIQRAVTELVRGRTVVVVAHRLASVRHADHILVLDRGRLVDQGRHVDLMQRVGLYSRLWAAQHTEHNWHLRASP